MYSKTTSASLLGIDAVEIQIELDASLGLPTENIVGLPDTVIKESKSRIRTAIKNSGFEYPVRAYTINLAPADLPKQGPLFDLAIAVGLLNCTAQLKPLENSLVIGELSLNGDVKGVKGVLSICHMAIKKGYQYLVLPEENSQEAHLIPGITLVPIKNLKDLPTRFENPTQVPKSVINTKPNKSFSIDFSEIKGQLLAKRAIEIAITGNHHILMMGPPGSGKSMMAKRMQTILPTMTFDEAVSTFKIKSVSNFYSSNTSFTFDRPFRSPHHAISYAGMVGGGSHPKPGEISLSHNGILFLDELPEFQRQVIDVLRQPLEDGNVTISRAAMSISYPANFMLVGAMNPCPCGYYGDAQKQCQCQPAQIQRYLKKISGPILDRFDIIIDVPRLKKEDYLNTKKTERSSNIKQRVLQAQKYKLKRQNKTLSDDLEVSDKTQTMLGEAVENGLLTGRSHDKIISLSRTIADLEECKKIEEKHVLEAMQLRKKALI